MAYAELLIYFMRLICVFVKKNMIKYDLDMGIFVQLMKYRA